MRLHMNLHPYTHVYIHTSKSMCTQHTGGGETILHDNFIEANTPTHQR